VRRSHLMILPMQKRIKKKKRFNQMNYQQNIITEFDYLIGILVKLNANQYKLLFNIIIIKY
jgi:predicted secreted protein